MQDPQIVSIAIPSAYQGVRARYFAIAWLGLPFYSPGLEFILDRFGTEWTWYWWDVFGAYYLYALFFVAILIMLAGARGFPVRACFGRTPAGSEYPGALKLTAFLFIASISLAYLLYYPLSYLLPDFVQWWVIDVPSSVFFDEQDFPLLPNLLMVLFMSGLVPFVEEFAFRGVILPRWASKYGFNKALLMMSALFAIVHTDPLGAFLFSVCMGALYLRTQSLWLPIFCHAVNNLVAWGFDLAYSIIDGPEHQYSIEEFRAGWGWGVGCGVAAVAWAVLYFKGARRNVAWRFPVA